MNTIIAHPKPKTQEWLKKATGLKASALVEVLLEQEEEKVLFCQQSGNGFFKPFRSKFLRTNNPKE